MKRVCQPPAPKKSPPIRSGGSFLGIFALRITRFFSLEETYNYVAQSEARAQAMGNLMLLLALEGLSDELFEHQISQI